MIGYLEDRRHHAEKGAFASLLSPVCSIPRLTAMIAGRRQPYGIDDIGPRLGPVTGLFSCRRIQGRAKDESRL